MERKPLMPRMLRVLFASVLLAAASLPASDWPQFRANPALTGISNETLPAQPALLWTFKTGGPVKSSPVIAGGSVFVGSHDSNLVAISLADGKKRWSFTAQDQIEAPA